MTEIMPIPDDENQVNAKRLLKLQAELLLANGVSTKTLDKKHINPENPDDVNDQNVTLRNSFSRSRGVHMGAFVPDGAGKRLVGALETHRMESWHFAPYLTPLERLAMRRSVRDNEGIVEGQPFGIVALLAESGEQQQTILAELLTKVPQFKSDSVYIALPPIDPAREVVLEDGFTDTKRQAVKYGIPHNLFVRHIL